MYKLCSIEHEKERVVSASRVKLFTVGGGAGIGDNGEGTGGFE